LHTLSRDLLSVLEQALEGGVRAIQLREKDLSGKELFVLAEKARRLCDRYQAALLINDRVDVALAIDVAGVQLGKPSLPLPDARALLGNNRFIGASVHSPEEAQDAERGGADFIVFGPVYFTPSKAAVGTPQGEDGSADLRHVLDVARAIGQAINKYTVVVDKSTVPVGTAKKVRATIAKETSQPFSVVSNPEFLKQGAAVEDFMKPDRVVVGVDPDDESSLPEEILKALRQVREGERADRVAASELHRLVDIRGRSDSLRSRGSVRTPPGRPSVMEARPADRGSGTAARGSAPPSGTGPRRRR